MVTGHQLNAIITDEFIHTTALHAHNSLSASLHAHSSLSASLHAHSSLSAHLVVGSVVDCYTGLLSPASAAGMTSIHVSSASCSSSTGLPSSSNKDPEHSTLVAVVMC